MRRSLRVKVLVLSAGRSLNFGSRRSVGYRVGYSIVIDKDDQHDKGENEEAQEDVFPRYTFVRSHRMPDAGDIRSGRKPLQGGR